MYKLRIRTSAHAELRDITPDVQQVVSRAGVRDGIVYVYVPHTTAGVTINENADPTVKSDMLRQLELLAPWKQPFYQHAEGNSAAHVKASLMGFSATIFIENGKLALGTWQGLFLAEFDGPRERSVWVKVQADG
jgi:secondary thiamine-phosphate synthase enzyme